MLSGGLRIKGITKHSKENMPLITVVTVVRNGEKTLEETILSVINQTYKNVEYIVVDGASTDGTLDIIRKYEDKIDYWMSESDKGIYYAMNKGIDLAYGDWINFMNSGDSFYKSDVIENINTIKDSYSDVVYGNTNVCFKGYSIKKQSKLPSDKEYMPFCHQAALVKRSIAQKWPFDVSYKICADKDFFHKIYFAKYKFQYLPFIICNYEGEQGLSAQQGENLIKEAAFIDNRNAKRKWIICHRVSIISFKVKKIIKKCLPSYVVMKIQKLKQL